MKIFIPVRLIPECLTDQMPAVRCCIDQHIFRLSLKTSLDHCLQIFILDLKLFKRQVIHIYNELIVTVLHLGDHIIQILELVFIHFDHAQPLIIILVQDRFDRGGFTRPRVSEEQAVVRPAPLYECLRIVDKLLLRYFISYQIVKMYMGDICNWHDLHISPFGMLNTECLMEPQFTHSEFLVELCHLLLKLFCISSFPESFRQRADAVSHPAVKYLSRPAAVRIAHEHLNAAGAKDILEPAEIIVEQLFENAEIMERDLIDAAFDLSHYLTGGTVCILVVYKEERQICMPQIPLKSMAH